jgi:hypothetical protein
MPSANAERVTVSCLWVKSSISFDAVCNLMYPKIQNLLQKRLTVQVYEIQLNMKRKTLIFRKMSNMQNLMLNEFDDLLPHVLFIDEA